jgi:hypothetical protein
MRCEKLKAEYTSSLRPHTLGIEGACNSMREARMLPLGEHICVICPYKGTNMLYKGTNMLHTLVA